MIPVWIFVFSDGKMVNDVLKVLALLEDDRREKNKPHSEASDILPERGCIVITGIQLSNIDYGIEMQE